MVTLAGYNGRRQLLTHFGHVCQKKIVVTEQIPYTLTLKIKVHFSHNGYVVKIIKL